MTQTVRKTYHNRAQRSNNKSLGEYISFRDQTFINENIAFLLPSFEISPNKIVRSFFEDFSATTHIIWMKYHEFGKRGISCS
jgi:hypothetical protein